MKRKSYQSQSYSTNAFKYLKKANSEDDEDSKNDSDSKQDSNINMEQIEEMLMAKKTGVDVIGNHIYFRATVTKKSVSELVKVITKLNSEFDLLKAMCKIGKLEPVPIYLHVTSGGGDLFYGFIAYDCIKNSKLPIYTIIDGEACSAASIMCVAGVKRLATKTSFTLIHQLSSGAFGTFEQLSDSHHNNNLLMVKIKAIYLENTKIKSKELDSLMKRDLLFDVNKCLKYGIIDEIYEGVDEV